MRQTSRAVALLLAVESANAAPTVQLPASGTGIPYYDTVFNPTVNTVGAPTNSNQLNSRTAGYTNSVLAFNPDGTSPTWGSAAYRFGIVGDAAAANLATIVTTKKGSGCMVCINGGGVWCSRTYSYLSTSSTNLFMADGTAKEFTSTVLPASAPASITSDALDGGSCCDSQINFNLFVGTKLIPVRAGPASNDHTTSIAAAGLIMINVSCPAIKNTYVTGASNAFGQSEIDDATTSLSSWWCSNGLYKKVTTAGSVKVVNSQQVIINTQNKRQELAQVGCPNAATMCNTGSTVAFELTGSVLKRDIVMPLTVANGFTTASKCTWVTWSTVSAPSWILKESSNIGLTGRNWILHAMEYTAAATGVLTFVPANGSLVPGAGSGVIKGNEALADGNMTPLFTMPGDQFATLRTWYGEGKIAVDDITQQSSNWLSPGLAPIANTKPVSLQLAGVANQLYGNVANVPVSGNVMQATAGNVALTATQNYGKYNNTLFDLRQMRYFPAKVAQTQHAAGTTAAATYATALSSYNTAKTTWDAYVAILEKNAKQDAFAALFSPPKAPTVPPLPNKPWLPAAYSGYTRASVLQVQSFTNNNANTSVASPTSSQVWTNLAAAQTVGGWGSFTATLFAYRNGWGKSFGTIGYDGTTTAMGDVWNYKWQCIVASTTTVHATSQCAPTYTVTAGTQTVTGTPTTALNTTKMISVVSLWSTAFSATSETKYAWGTTKNGFAITFNAGVWTSGIVPLASIAAPTAAVAAKSLTGIAGAQALVASSAAALAVAAALY